MERPMDIQHLQRFAAVARYGTITKAADELFISQQAMSASIKQLEAEIGRPLFAREGKRLALTTTGKHLLDRAEPLLDGFDSLSAAMGIGDNPSSIPSVYFSGKHLSRHLLNHVFDDGIIPVNLVDERCDTLFEQLLSRHADAVVMGALDIPASVPASIEIVELYTTQLLLFAPKDHPLRKLESIRYRDVLDIPLIKNSSDRLTTSWIDGIETRCGISFTYAMTMFQNPVSEMERWLSLPYWGEATILASTDPALDSFLESIHPIPIADEYAHQDVVLAYRKSRYPDIEQFIACMVSNAPNIARRIAERKRDIWTEQ